MKTRTWITALALIMMLTLTTASLASDNYGALAVREGNTYPLEQMLTYALQDEQLALAEYQAILNAFDTDRPFSNIIKAEEHHVSLLLPLFAAHGIAVPENTAQEHVTLPATLKEVFAVGVEVEVNNIAMFNTFLAQNDLPDDVREVFEWLKRASENHLRAFERGLNRPEGGRYRQSDR